MTSYRNTKHASSGQELSRRTLGREVGVVIKRKNHYDGAVFRLYQSQCLIRILYYSLLGCYHYGNLDKGYLYQGSPIGALYIISYNCFTSLVF